MGALPQTPSSSAEQRPAGPHTATVNLPFVTATFRAPQFRVPAAMDPRRLAHRAGDAATSIREALPPRRQLVYYTGLGVLAVSEIVEWPVALAIGAGTVIAQQGRGAQQPAGSTAGSSSSTGSSE